jgi:protein-disulfide isomerase
MHILPRTLRILPILAVSLAMGCGDANSQNAGSPPDAAAAGADGQNLSAQEQAIRERQERQVHDLVRLGHIEGDDDAAVVAVIEFSDFGCVHCARFHLESYPALHEEFIAAGDVAWKYIPISIGGFPNGDVAAVAGECAAQQDLFAPLRDRLFETREEWMTSGDAAGLIIQHAADLGLDQGEFESCLAEDEEARQRIEDGNRVARELGVRGTPTFIVQGHPVQGAPPLDSFQQVLRELVAEARSPGS